MTLSIIIVSYNVKYFLEQCLCSVGAAIKGIEAEVWVIDNRSSDGTLPYLQPRFDWVSFIENDANEGFAKANNKALRRCSGKYVLFLNPDTILQEDTLRSCLLFFTKTPDAGAVGVRMVDGCGRFLPESKRSFPAPLVSFYKLSGLSALFPHSRHFGRYALGYLPDNEVHKVDVLAGAFMMIPKHILALTGGFDEQFFMYAEDIDLSYRIQQAGYINYYLGHLSIVHFKGESTKKGNLNYVATFYGAMWLFVKKHYRGASAWLLRQCLQAGIWARGAVSAVPLVLALPKKHTAFTYTNIYLCGESGQTGIAASIMQHYYPDASVTMLPHFPTTHKSTLQDTLVVFCTGSLTYAQSIEWLQQSNATSYKWFGKGTGSIAGSHNRNFSGEVLVIDTTDN